MTNSNPTIDGRPVVPGAPMDPDGPRFPIYTPEFAADPHGAYAEMRRHHPSLAPVEIAPGTPATLVIGYRTAVRILHDPERFPADPRAWQKKVPADCPILPMLEWRPNALRSSGFDHVRYRSANKSAIEGVDLHAMHAVVERIAVPLINGFCADGRADLLSQYIHPLVFTALNTMLGCSADIGQRVAAGMAAVFESGEGAEAGNQMLLEALLELTGYRRAHPEDDITSRLVTHETGLTDEEMIHQLVTLYGAGIEPEVNLIANTVLLMLTDDRFAGSVLDGRLKTRDALDEVLFTDPPMANYCVSYPRQPMLVDGVWLPANEPVLISMSACNNDPAVNPGGADALPLNSSHLAWSAGPHSCPAHQVATLIAQDAIDQLLDALPEIELAVPREQLTWRPGPFHRALESLPVTFPPTAPLTTPA
ncbi:cytochrome P450 [Nocardia farcinica]|uniref:cytochrome P450 n=1 Tax=Nocardia farcinica TaxID=37329 RepID=UPI0018957366|nr:cytochrome P450 [Nocardia farcinica]MBF6375283.1 cytochrome P450 [Nocardia farcinica]